MNRKQKRPAAASAAAGRTNLNLYLTLGVVAVALLVLGGVLLVNRSSGEDLTAPAVGGGHALSVGPAGAPELVEYIDFQCESCHAFHQNITARLLDDYDGRITFTVRLFPLPGHPLGLPAARAAEAAALQGSFAPFHTILFDEYSTWAAHGHSTGTDDIAAGRSYFLDVADRLGLDLETFTRDMDSEAVLSTIRDSAEGGQALGVTSTPTFFLDGEKFGDSANSYAEFDQQLRAALDARIG